MKNDFFSKVFKNFFFANFSNNLSLLAGCKTRTLFLYSQAFFNFSCQCFNVRLSLLRVQRYKVLLDIQCGFYVFFLVYFLVDWGLVGLGFILFFIREIRITSWSLFLWMGCNGCAVTGGLKPTAMRSVVPMALCCGGSLWILIVFIFLTLLGFRTLTGCCYL